MFNHKIPTTLFFSFTLKKQPNHLLAMRLKLMRGNDPSLTLLVIHEQQKTQTNFIFIKSIKKITEQCFLFKNQKEVSNCKCAVT